MPIPKMPGIIIPPPPPKKQLWRRYAEGEKLKATYEPLFKPSRIPAPEIPGDRREKSGADGFEIIMYAFLILAMIVIGGVYSLT